MGADRQPPPGRREPRILSEMQAKEAAMNGAVVRYRRSPPYRTCPACGGNGTNFWPFQMGCGPHEEGWEVVERPEP